MSQNNVVRVCHSMLYYNSSEVQHVLANCLIVILPRKSAAPVMVFLFAGQYHQHQPLLMATWRINPSDYSSHNLISIQAYTEIFSVYSGKGNTYILFIAHLIIFKVLLILCEKLRRVFGWPSQLFYYLW